MSLYLCFPAFKELLTELESSGGTFKRKVNPPGYFFNNETF